MSYHTWITYGYGVCISDIDTKKIKTENLVKLIHMAPYFEEKLINWINEYLREDGDPESIYELMQTNDILEYEDEGCYVGLAPILKGVMDECEHLYFVICDNYNGYEFLLFTQGYPWEMGDKELALKEKDVEDMFRKYISILTDQKININYYEVENGG